MSTGEYPNVINVLLVLTVVRVEVECGRVSHVTPRFVRNNGYVVANLTLVGIALEGVKRIAHRNISRPGHAGVSAKGIEKLRVRVIDSVARVIPNRIEPSVGRC